MIFIFLNTTDLEHHGTCGIGGVDIVHRYEIWDQFDAMERGWV